MEGRGFITLIHVMASKFNIVITGFKTCRRQNSILNTKYYESPFEKLRVWKNDIIITKLSKNNSNETNNEYYNLESFEKLIFYLCLSISTIYKSCFILSLIQNSIISKIFFNLVSFVSCLRRESIRNFLINFWKDWTEYVITNYIRPLY